MDKLALTGFTVFSTHSVNPTEILVNKFSSLSFVNGMVVPVSYQKSKETAKTIQGKFLLMTGLAAGRKAISIEKFAYNQKKATIPDSDGVFGNGERIEEEGPESLETEVDTDRIVSLLNKAGIPASLSLDPGRYVCNNIYYSALYTKRPSLFVHFPRPEDMDLEDQEKALRIILDYLKENYLSTI